MADINVVRKRNSIWPWLLGVLLLVLLIWGVAEVLGGGAETPAPPVEQAEP